MLDDAPTGWEATTLGDLTIIVGGTTPKRAIQEYWDDASICWATPTDITSLPTSCYELRDTKEKISKTAVERGGAKVLPCGTVLMTSRATIGYVAVAEVETATNQGFANFLPSHRFDPRFLCYALEFKRQELESNSGGSTFKEISKASLKRLALALPPLSEQKRISEILSSVDDSIRATEAVIEQAERVKRGLMEDLLTGGLGSEAIARGEVPDGWIDATAKDIALPKGLQTGPFGSQLKAAEYYEGPSDDVIYVVMPKDIINGRIDFPSCSRITPEKAAQLDKHILRAGDVLFARRGDLNRPGFTGEGLVQ